MTRVEKPARFRKWALLMALVLAGLGGSLVLGDEAPKTPAELFEESHVWTVHLTFTPQEWTAMEPENSGRRGGPGRMGPQRRNFGPSVFLAPALLTHGDKNEDGALTKEEFVGVANQWFTDWDTDKAGKLDQEHVRLGLNSVVDAKMRGGINLQAAEGKRNGLAGANGIDFQYVHADLDFSGKVIKDVGIRFKGNGTWMQSRGTNKHSLKVELNRFEKGQKLAGVVKLNLHNNITDPSWMNEVMSYRLYRDCGVPAPRTSYAKVYITVPGKYNHQYLGLYSIVEDIDKHFEEDHFASKKGAIFKPVTPEPFEDLGRDWEKYKQTYDPKTDLSVEQAQRVMDFCRLVSHADDATFAAKLPEFLDLEEFARYMSATVYLSTLDSILMLGQNYYVYLDHKTNRFEFLPWDLDHSFGQFPMIGSQSQRENLSIQHPWRGDIRLMDRVFKTEAFQKVYRARMEEFGRTLFKPERFAQQVDELAAALRPAVKEESPAKLSEFNIVVADPNKPPEAGPQPRGIFGFVFGNNSRPANTPIKPFVVARTKSVLDQLAGRSKGEVLDPMGFGARGRGAFGPGNLLSPPFVIALDANKDGNLSREEFVQGFAKWFDAWDTNHSGRLGDAQLRDGLDKALGPNAARPPGRPMRADNQDRPRGRPGRRDGI